VKWCSVEGGKVGSHSELSFGEGGFSWVGLGEG
jgi:hypothetical protein